MLENKVSTAEEVLMQHYDTNYRSNYKEGISKQCYIEAAIIFAKLHREAILKEIASWQEHVDYDMIKDAYPEELIK